MRSRACSLSPLCSMPAAAATSITFYYDASGQAHEVLQGEGGEQGDPLKPGLYAFGQHTALTHLHVQLQPGFLQSSVASAKPSSARKKLLVLTAVVFNSFAGILSSCHLWSLGGGGQLLSSKCCARPGRACRGMPMYKSTSARPGPGTPQGRSLLA